MRLNQIAPKTGSKHRARRVGRGIAAGQGARSGTGTKA
jgi:large subunit ribosomal protein L15